MKYDLVVAGAGPAGICAAVEASRLGLRVALIERYGCVGGNLTLGCVGPLLGEVSGGTMGEEIEARICKSRGLVPDFELAKKSISAVDFVYLSGEEMKAAFEANVEFYAENGADVVAPEDSAYYGI